MRREIIRMGILVVTLVFLLVSCGDIVSDTGEFIKKNLPADLSGLEMVAVDHSSSFLSAIGDQLATIGSMEGFSYENVSAIITGSSNSTTARAAGGTLVKTTTISFEEDSGSIKPVEGKSIIEEYADGSWAIDGELTFGVEDKEKVNEGVPVRYTDTTVSTKGDIVSGGVTVNDKEIDTETLSALKLLVDAFTKIGKEIEAGNVTDPDMGFVLVSLKHTFRYPVNGVMKTDSYSGSPSELTANEEYNASTIALLFALDGVAGGETELIEEVKWKIILANTDPSIAVNLVSDSTLNNKATKKDGTTNYHMTYKETRNGTIKVNDTSIEFKNFTDEYEYLNVDPSQIGSFFVEHTGIIVINNVEIEVTNAVMKKLDEFFFDR